MPLFDLVTFNEKEEKNYHKMSIKDIMKDVFSREDLIDRQGRISPSSGCSFCPKQAFLRGIESFTDNWDASSEIYARNGVLMENMVSEGLQQSGLLLGQGIRLWENEELRLGAEFDLAINQNNKFKIIECKTCSELPTNIDSKPYQYWQLLLYQAYYCCDGVLLYVSRKVMGKHGSEMDLLIKQFESPFDLSLCKAAIYRSALSRWYIDNKIMPQKPSYITSKGHCGFCNFLNQCWDNSITKHEEERPIHFLEANEYAEEYMDKFFSKYELEKRRGDLWLKLYKYQNPEITDINAKVVGDEMTKFVKLFDYFGE